MYSIANPSEKQDKKSHKGMLYKGLRQYFCAMVILRGASIVEGQLFYRLGHALFENQIPASQPIPWAGDLVPARFDAGVNHDMMSRSPQQDAKCNVLQPFFTKTTLFWS